MKAIFRCIRKPLFVVITLVLGIVCFLAGVLIP